LTPLTFWSFILAIVALLISIWGRIETYLIGNRQRKIELSKRVGEALVSSQLLKNTISENIDTLKKSIENEKDSLTKTVLQNLLAGLDKEYTQIWDFVSAFEKITGEFELGKSLSIDHSSIEAKIALFNQRRILAEFDIAYLSKKLAPLK